MDAVDEAYLTPSLCRIHKKMIGQTTGKVFRLNYGFVPKVVGSKSS